MAVGIEGRVSEAQFIALPNAKGKTRISPSGPRLQEPFYTHFRRTGLLQRHRSGRRRSGLTICCPSFGQSDRRGSNPKVLDELTGTLLLHPDHNRGAAGNRTLMKGVGAENHFQGSPNGNYFTRSFEDLSYDRRGIFRPKSMRREGVAREPGRVAENLSLTA